MKWYIRDTREPLEESYVNLCYCCEICGEYYPESVPKEWAESYSSKQKATEALDWWDRCGWVIGKYCEVVCVEEE